MIRQPRGNPRDVLHRPAPVTDLSLRYGEHPGQVADVWLPTADDRPGEPLVLFFHGGFWRAEFDRTHVAGLACDLAGRGYPAATVEYRRVGQAGGGWPGTFSDVAAAVAAVPDLLNSELQHRGMPGVQADRPVLAGHSAGGQLALWYAGVAPDAVRGVLALAPVADLAGAQRDRIGDDAVLALLGGTPQELPDRYASADPMAHLPLKVPAVIVHGTDDDRVPIELSRGYIDAARRSGDSATLVELDGVEHFAVIDPQSAAWPAVVQALRTVAD